MAEVTKPDGGKARAGPTPLPPPSLPPPSAAGRTRASPVTAQKCSFALIDRPAGLHPLLQSSHP